MYTRHDKPSPLAGQRERSIADKPIAPIAIITCYCYQGSCAKLRACTYASKIESRSAVSGERKVQAMSRP